MRLHYTEKLLPLQKILKSLKISKKLVLSCINTFQADRKTRFHWPESVRWKIYSSWRINWFHRHQLTVVWENERKWVPLARNSATLVKIYSSFYNSTSFSDGFHVEKNLWTKEKRFPLAGNPFPLARMKDFVEIDVSSRPKKLPLSLNYTNHF